jgi:putative SOS response-associated peptidase YedK
MCGRFTLRHPLDQILARFQIQSTFDESAWRANYNVAPSQLVPVVREREGGYELDTMKWGLVPSWADDPKIGYKMINAKAETIAEKPSFSRLIKQQRCGIPSDGFYEWQKAGKTKQAMYIRPADQDLFLFAGLWSRWRRDEAEILSCTIITTAPNEDMAPIHDRMPAILKRDDEAVWLDPAYDNADHLKGLLAPYPGRMIAVAVSSRVNSPGYNAPDCVEPVTGLFG